MRLQWLLSACVTVTIVGQLYADVASILPRTNIDIRVRFENLDEYPNFDFYLKYELGYAMYLTKVESNKMIRLEGVGTRVSDVYLMAIPRGQVADPHKHREYPDKDNWLRTPQKGALQSPGFPEVFNGHEIDYRVQIEDNQLYVIWVKSRTPWFPHEATDQLALLCVGFSLSAFFIAAGFVIRRRRKRAALPAVS